MDFIVPILADIAGPTLNFIGKMIDGLNGAVGSFGWTIILFTLILKAITLPIEFWQRYSAQKNKEKMTQMKPMIEKIDKAYGDNKRGAQAEKNKLYKKYGYSIVAGCLPSLVTMAIFIFMLTGLSSYTAYTNYNQYKDLNEKYYAMYYDTFRSEYAEKYNLAPTVTDEQIKSFESELIAPTDPDSDYVFSQEDRNALIASTQTQIGNYSRENRESFMWMKNIWRPDTWSKVMPTYKDFSSGTLGMTAVKGFDEQEYQIIYDGVLKQADTYGKDGSWNGLMLLPILSLVSQFFSMRLSLRAQAGGGSIQNATDPAVQSQKLMQWMMPVMMVFFTLFYTGAFALYIVSNAILSILSTLLMTPLIKRLRKNKQIKIIKEDVSYRR
jgi:YidC/Oxa1 family membrane protein insertase